MGGNNWRCDFQLRVDIYGSSCFHFTVVLESRFLDPGHNHYCQLISIMPFLVLSSVPDFLLWSFFSYFNPSFFLFFDSVFSTKIAPKLRKQIWSMTTWELGATSDSRYDVRVFFSLPSWFYLLRYKCICTSGKHGKGFVAYWICSSVTETTSSPLIKFQVKFNVLAKIK